MKRCADCGYDISVDSAHVCLSDAEFDRILTECDPKPDNLARALELTRDIAEKRGLLPAETSTSDIGKAISGTRILAIDPGTAESGWCYLFGDKVGMSGVFPNEDMLRLIASERQCAVAIEMVASYGMAVGREVFETCVWIGRFMQASHQPEAVKLVYRRDVKLHLCGNPRAKDANIRQALLDLIGPQGTKKQPGPTYGVKSHAWAALGVAVTAAHQLTAGH